MKRKLILAFVCMFIMVSAIGCGSNNSENLDSKKGEPTAAATPTVVPTKVPTQAPTQTPTPTVAPTKIPTQVPATKAPATKKPAVKPANIKLGSSWKQIHSEEYKYEFYAAGFNNKKQGVTVGYAGEIHYTKDGAKKWNNANNSSACLFGLDFATDQVVYTCGNQGNVTKSTDGGEFFELVSPFGDSEPEQCQVMSFCDENNGIIASDKRMAKTSDGGKTWTEITIPSNIVAIYMTAPDTFYFMDTSFSINKTSDGGTTWETTPTNLKGNYFTGIKSVALYVDAENAFTIFCTDMNLRELKSFSTIDNWGKIKENKVPKVKGVLYFYINHKGDTLTISNLNEKKIVILGKK